MAVPVPPLPPPPGVGRVNQNGTPTQAQIDYERKLSKWILDYLVSSSGGTVPFPTPTTIGGVKSATAPTHQFQRGIDTSGNSLFAQPAAGDISGLGPFATASSIAVGSITGLGSLATISSIDLASQATGNLGISHLNSGIDANSSHFWRGDGTWATLTATPGGSSGQVQFNNAGALGGFTVGGDGSLDVTTGLLSVTKTGGVAFAPSATTDTTNASNIGSGTLGAARLPNPSATTLGGIQSKVAAASQWINSISTAGVPSLTQPAFTDISGSVAASQLPNPSSSTLGGIRSFAAVSHQFLTSISTSGIPSAAQPTFADISGTLAASQLPNPSATTLGGIESFTAVSHQWINAISTSGVPSSTQPAASDLSNGTSGTSGAVVLANNPTLSGVTLNGNTTAGNIAAATVTGSSANFTTLVVAGSGSGPGANITNTSNAAQLHLSGTGNDDGGYAVGFGTNALYLGAGATYDGTNTIAKATSASILGVTASGLSLQTNSGLTVGSSYSPTLRFNIDSTGILTAGTVPAARTSGFATVATSGSASDLSTGTLPSAAFPTVSSWTPVLKFGGATTGITYSTQTGSILRLGKLIIAQAHITLSSKGTATGNATITGLTDTSRAESGKILWPYYAGMAGMTSAGGFIDANGTTLNLLGNASEAATNYNPLTNANFSNSTEFFITITYLAA